MRTWFYLAAPFSPRQMRERAHAALPADLPADEVAAIIRLWWRRLAVNADERYGIHWGPATGVAWTDRPFNEEQARALLARVLESTPVVSDRRAPDVR
ncbi:hypothetical protein [Fodinicola acaciae]|uniref:hypothetical protein n=1 Tax=Fodinicola acaciae TaxID=2681555 RepID=UPI0013D8CE19|nr:hypothetical protein [Fodinicola acaciae]